MNIELTDEELREAVERNALEDSRRCLHDAVLRSGLTLTDDVVEKMKAFLEGKPVVLSSGFGPVPVDVVTQRGAEDVQFPKSNKGANEQ